MTTTPYETTAVRLSEAVGQLRATGCHVAVGAGHAPRRGRYRYVVAPPGVYLDRILRAAAQLAPADPGGDGCTVDGGHILVTSSWARGATGILRTLTEAAQPSTVTTPPPSRPVEADAGEWMTRCYCRPPDVRSRGYGAECGKCGTEWVPAVLVFGRVDTGHYLFEALGRSREEVQQSLLAAYARHAAQNPYADADVMAERIDDDEVSWTELRVGQAAIDGEPIS